MGAVRLDPLIGLVGCHRCVPFCCMRPLRFCLGARAGLQGAAARVLGGGARVRWQGRLAHARFGSGAVGLTPAKKRAGAIVSLPTSVYVRLFSFSTIPGRLARQHCAPRRQLARSPVPLPGNDVAVALLRRHNGSTDSMQGCLGGSPRLAERARAQPFEPVS